MKDIRSKLKNFVRKPIVRTALYLTLSGLVFSGCENKSKDFTDVVDTDYNFTGRVRVEYNIDSGVVAVPRYQIHANTEGLCAFIDHDPFNEGDLVRMKYENSSENYSFWEETERGKRLVTFPARHIKEYEILEKAEQR